MNLRCRVAPIEQHLRDDRVLRDVFELLRSLVDAIEIRAEADMVDTGDFDDVLDVIGDVEHVTRLDRIFGDPAFASGPVGMDLNTYQSYLIKFL